MMGIRRAAATLYGLHQDDRETILAELSSVEQAELRSALAELEALGFARSIGAMFGTDEPGPLANALPAASEDAGDAGDVWTRRLMTEDDNRMHRVLALEPASLIAELLQLGPWPWAEPFLHRLDVRRQQQVRDLLFSNGAFPAARRCWLLRSVVAQLEALPAEPSTASPSRVRSTLRPLRWLPWRA
jgi:hypothetical protein